MAAKYGAQADFLVVYIREAHAVDSEWPMREEGQPVIEQPLDLHERRAAAESCLGTLSMSPLPAVLDEMDDAVSTAWEAWPDGLVLIDELSNACLWTGAQLTRGRVIAFRHNDMSDLERLLKQHRSAYLRTMIVTDGVFSMDGDLAPISEL